MILTERQVTTIRSRALSSSRVALPLLTAFRQSITTGAFVAAARRDILALVDTTRAAWDERDRARGIACALLDELESLEGAYDRVVVDLDAHRLAIRSLSDPPGGDRR